MAPAATILGVTALKVRPLRNAVSAASVAAISRAAATCAASSGSHSPAECRAAAFSRMRTPIGIPISSMSAWVSADESRSDSTLVNCFWRREAG